MKCESFTVPRTEDRKLKTLFARRSEMKQTRFLRPMLVFGLPILLIGATTALAQSKTRNGILKIHVSPKQAYVFVDAIAIRDGSQAIALAGRARLEHQSRCSRSSHRRAMGDC